MWSVLLVAFGVIIVVCLIIALIANRRRQDTDRDVFGDVLRGKTTGEDAVKRLKEIDRKRGRVF
jgi:hypothetical protein